MNGYFIFGLITTIAYLICAGLYLANVEQSLFGINLNELGDFLAGIFSPLAFLWLVLGFLQQGKELKQNGEALRLQADELRNSVEQQRELVEAAREQINIDKKIISEQARVASLREQPKFILSGGGNSSSGAGRMYRYSIKNVGERCSEINVVATGPGLQNCRSRTALLERGEELSFAIFTHDNEISGQIDIEISCTDINSLRRNFFVRLMKDRARITGSPQAATEGF